MAKDQFVPAFFKDFGKAVSDILRPSKYDLGRQVEVKSKSDSGVNFTSSSNLLAENSSGKVTIKSASVCKNFDVEAVLNASGKGSVKVSHTKLYDGLKVVASNDTHPAKGTSLHGTDISYSRKNVSVSSNVQSNKFKDYKYHGSLSVGHAGVSVGGDVHVNNGDISNYSAGAQYEEDDFVLTVKTLNKADSLLASYSHKIDKDVTVVAAFTYDLAKSSSNGQSLAVGGAYSIDKDSKAAAMYTTDGSLSAVYETNVRKNCKLALATTTNIEDFSRQKFGFKVTLG